MRTNKKEKAKNRTKVRVYVGERELRAFDFIYKNWDMAASQTPAQLLKAGLFVLAATIKERNEKESEALGASEEGVPNDATAEYHLWPLLDTLRTG